MLDLGRYAVAGRILKSEFWFLSRVLNVGSLV
jgi:hypothetical protein